MESAEFMFKSSQMNKLTVRTFPDGTLSFFVNTAGEDIGKSIPLTFYPELANEVKKSVFEYDNSILQEQKKEIGNLSKQLSKALEDNSRLSNQIILYEESKKKFEQLKSIKSSIINGITNLNPNTRVYACKNGEVHNKDVLVDVEDFREEIKNIIDNQLKIGD